MLTLSDVEQFAKENNVKYQIIDEKDFSTEKSHEGIKRERLLFVLMMTVMPQDIL